MIKPVLIAAVAGFCWPYFFDVSIPGLQHRRLAAPWTPITLASRSISTSESFQSQTVNRSRKGDKLQVVQSSDAASSIPRNDRRITPVLDVNDANCRQRGQMTRLANVNVGDLYHRVWLTER